MNILVCRRELDARHFVFQQSRSVRYFLGEKVNKRQLICVRPPGLISPFQTSHASPNPHEKLDQTRANYICG